MAAATLIYFWQQLKTVINESRINEPPVVITTESHQSKPQVALSNDSYCKEDSSHLSLIVTATFHILMTATNSSSKQGKLFFAI